MSNPKKKPKPIEQVTQRFASRADGMNHSRNEAQGRMNINSVNEEVQSNPDPIVQEKDFSNGSQKGEPSSEIVLASKETMAASNVTTWPNRFMPAGEPRQAVPSANDIISSLLRFKWTILIVFLLVSIPAITLIWTQVVPKYQARAEVRVRPIIPRLVFRTDENGQIPFYDSFVNTQVSVMRSLTVLQRVLDQQDIQQTQWYKNPQKLLVQRLRGNTYPPLERLKDTLSVQPRPRTEIIDVRFIDPRAKEAKLIVDTVLDQYLRYIGEMSDEDERKLYQQLLEEYKSLETYIQGREAAVAALCKTLGTAAPEELVASRRVRLDETIAQHKNLQNTITLLEWEKRQFTTDDGNDTSAAEKQPRYYQDVEWRQLDRNVKTLQHQMTNGRYTPNHPDMAMLKKDLEFAEELLQERQNQLDELWNNRIMGASEMPMAINDPNGLRYPVEKISVEQQLARAKREEELLKAELEKQQAEFHTLFETAQSLKKENDDLKHKRDLFEAVQQQKDQKNMERNVPGSIEVLTRAFVPSQPYNDRRIVFTAMVLMMSLGAGGGVGFLRATRRQAIYVPNDMPYAMQVPLLGYVPVTQVRKSMPRTFRKSSGKKRYAQDHLAESIRLVRTALLSRLGAPRNTILLITSTVAGTGKSHFTMKLGESLARAGKKVLIIDADFRKMGLTQRFNLSGKAGFVESLHSRSVDKRHIFPTDTFYLSIMPAGKLTDKGGVFEETANGAFKTCMAQLREQYDIILLDSAPILPVADAMILSSQVDGTIMVERELVSRRSSQTDALTRLVSSGGRLLGTVFVGSSDGKDYGYNYAYGKAVSK